MFDEVIDIPVIEVALDQPEIFRRDGFHLALEQYLQEFDILDDSVDLLAVESKRFFELVEDADEIEHKAMGFHHLLRLVLIRPVYSCDCLQESMVAHRLVEVHGIQYGCIEPGEQFLGNDENLRLLVKLAEAFSDLTLFLRIKMEFLEQDRIVIVPGVNDL